MSNKAKGISLAGTIKFIVLCCIVLAKKRETNLIGGGVGEVWMRGLPVCLS